MTPTQIADIHKLSLELLTQNERAKSETQMALRSIEARIERYKLIRDATKHVVCPGCRGYGNVQVWNAQDDVKSEKCHQCKGTGLREEQ